MLNFLIMRNILVTGGAGFIGSHLMEALLLHEDIQVTCIDNFDNFYDPDIKKTNIAGVANHKRFELIEGDITNFCQCYEKLSQKKYTSIIHLAAKAGVRPSIKNPQLYLDTNIIGTQNMLELARKLEIKKFILGSSSSVYGTNPDVPWNETNTNYNPISPYAASKLSAEMLGRVYSNLYGIQVVALRFFTVYGPRQRPDLAIHKFTKMIYEGKKIPFYGDGATKRDYTYVSDIVAGIIAATEYRKSMFEVINLGNSYGIPLLELIILLEKAIGKKVNLQYLPAQPGDVPQTYADILKAKRLLGYTPKVSIDAGLEMFIKWFRKANMISTPARHIVS
jgi:UDP-glucuronate 4-epimerase